MNRLTTVAVLFLACSHLFAGQRLPETEHVCFIVPITVAQVGSPVRGVIASLLVDRGDAVEKGQPIAELDSGKERVMLDYAEARADVKSELAAREADLELAKLELDRMADMHRQNLVSAQRWDEARIKNIIAYAALLQALENHKLVQIELQRANHDLAQRTLRSPANGVVVERFIEPGEFVYDEPVISIATVDTLRVEVVLPAACFGRIRRDHEALITPELDVENPLRAKVDAVDAILDTRSGTFGVRLVLSNQARTITAGQKCTIDFLPVAAAANELVTENE